MYQSVFPVNFMSFWLQAEEQSTICLVFEKNRDPKEHLFSLKRDDEQWLKDRNLGKSALNKDINAKKAKANLKIQVFTDHDLPEKQYSNPNLFRYVAVTNWRDTMF